MKYVISKRILATLLSAVLLAGLSPMSVSAAEEKRLIGTNSTSSSTEKETSTSTRGITGKTLVSTAKDFPTVSEEFLAEVKGKKSVTEAQLKKYAVEYNLPGPYMQRFFKNHFVFKDGTGKYTYIPVSKTLAKNKYNWKNLVHTSKEIKYKSDSLNGIKGIDVSTYQGNIDWKKVKADGVKYAIIRLGYRGYGTGALMIDDYYHQNMKNAKAAGVKVGVYFYSQAVNVEEAVEEAELVLKNIKNYELDYPVVFDIEDAPSRNARTAGMSKKTATDITIAFCERIKKAGHHPMVYANSRWFVSRLDMSRLTKYDKWLAQYYEIPFFPYQFQMWQYTGKGRVNGIKGDVDMNISFKNY